MAGAQAVAAHVGEDGPVPPDYHCNARKDASLPPSRDNLCRQRAGWGTDHTGEGRCKLHGGASPSKHGLYSQVTRHRLSDRIQQLREREDLLDLREQIALQVSVVQEYLHGLADEGLTQDDAKTLSDLVDRVSRNVERLHKMETKEGVAVRGSELQVVIAQVVAIVRQETDAQTAQRIGERLLGPGGEHE